MNNNAIINNSNNNNPMNNNSNRNSSANSRKSRLKSSQKNYSLGVVANSGKRYASVGTSGNFGLPAHQNSYASINKDGLMAKGSFVSTQQRIKDLINQNSNSRSEYRSSRKDAALQQQVPNIQKTSQQGPAGLEVKPDRLSRYFKRDSDYQRIKPAQQILDNINLNNRNDLKSKIRRVRGSLDSNLNHNSQSIQQRDKNNTMDSLGKKVSNELKDQFKSQRNDSLPVNSSQQQPMLQQFNSSQMSFYQKFLAKKMQEKTSGTNQDQSGMVKRTNTLTYDSRKSSVKPKKSQTLIPNQGASLEERIQHNQISRQRDAVSVYSQKQNDSDTGQGQKQLGLADRINYNPQGTNNYGSLVDQNGVRVPSRKGESKSTDKPKKVSGQITYNENIKRGLTSQEAKDEELKQRLKMMSSDLNWSKNNKPKSRSNSAMSRARKSQENIASTGLNDKAIPNSNVTSNKNEVKIDILKKKKPRIYHHLNQIRKMESVLPPVDRSKVIIKKFGTIEAFAVNTHVGTVREYNEDRVSILLNAQQR